MNKNLLTDLKIIRKKYNFTSLDPIIKQVANEVIQEECPHAEKYTQKGSCYYGEYEVTICRTCGKELDHIRGW